MNSMSRTGTRRLYKELHGFGCVYLPGEQLGRLGSGFTQFLLKRFVQVEASEERGKFCGVFRAAQNQASPVIFNHFARPGPRANNHGQGTGHRLKNRQAKSIFKRRADVGIGRGVKRENVGSGLQKVDTIKCFAFLQEGMVENGVVPSNHEKAQGKILI